MHTNGPVLRQRLFGSSELLLPDSCFPTEPGIFQLRDQAYSRCNITGFQRAADKLPDMATGLSYTPPFALDFTRTRRSLLFI